MNILTGILIPFIGTTAGAACVFFLKDQLRPVVQKTLLGFASGVMVAASVWSLLIPAMNMSEGMGRLAFVPSAVGFLFGIAFLLTMDKLIPHLHLNSEKPEGTKSSLQKTTMLVLAVTLHNIPEGMAVGVVFAGLLAENSGVTLAGFVNRYRDTKLSGGSHYFAAPEKRRRKQPPEGFLSRDALGHCGADRRAPDNSHVPCHCTGSSLSAGLCGRCHDLCRRRGSDTGIGRGRTL